jgi:hypothetical protein
MKNKEEEKIDTVQMMRKIRDKLSAKYSMRPDDEEKDLVAIRRKYGIKKKSSAAL